MPPIVVRLTCACNTRPQIHVETPRQEKAAYVRGGRGYRRGYDDGFTQRDYPQQTPEEILRRRYAAGEISRDQFEEMRRTLTPVA